MFAQFQQIYIESFEQAGMMQLLMVQNVLTPNFSGSTLALISVWVFLKPRDMSHDKGFPLKLDANVFCFM